MKLNVRALGLAGGIVWGSVIFLLTWWVLLLGYDGTLLSQLANVYLGYSVTWYGAFIGLLWAFADGFICCAALAWLYNRFAVRPSEVD